MIMMKCLAALSLAACAAYGSPVLYTFTATTRATLGSPAHTEAFQLRLPEYLPVAEGSPLISFLRTDPAVLSCTACTNAPVPALHFLRSGGSDLVQFADEDGTTRLYMFPLLALTSAGTHDTLPGINVAVGALTVAPVPEPSTTAMLVIGLAALALGARGRRSIIASRSPGRSREDRP